MNMKVASSPRWADCIIYIYIYVYTYLCMGTHVWVLNHHPPISKARYGTHCNTRQHSATHSATPISSDLIIIRPYRRHSTSHLRMNRHRSNRVRGSARDPQIIRRKTPVLIRGVSVTSVLVPHLVCRAAISVAAVTLHHCHWRRVCPF